MGSTGAIAPSSTSTSPSYHCVDKKYDDVPTTQTTHGRPTNKNSESSAASSTKEESQNAASGLTKNENTSSTSTQDQDSIISEPLEAEEN